MPAPRPALSVPAFVAAGLVAVTLSLASTGCLKLRGLRAAATPTPAAVKATPAGPIAPNIDYAAVRPNELGRIPVVMYHEFPTDHGKKPKPLSRFIDDFQKDLQTLYDAGFRPVNLSDVINDTIDVPAGKSPVVLTFDDARPSQFQLIETPQSLQIDPNSAMGVLDAFHKSHPDWPMKATFFVLPKSKATLEPFGQSGLGATKMQYIVDNGMEIGNHTTLHRNMRGMTPAQIQQELGNANEEILAAVPKASIETMALPMGMAPKKEYRQYLRKGVWQGKPYEFKAVMWAAWRPIPSPDSKEFNPDKLERIDGAHDGLNGLRDWITKLTRIGGTYQRYVSDGDPNVISFPKGDETLLAANATRPGKLINAYSPFGGPGGSKPIVSAPSAPGTVAPAGGATVEEAPAAKPIVGAESSAPAAAPPAASASTTIAPSVPAAEAPPAATSPAAEPGPGAASKPITH